MNLDQFEFLVDKLQNTQSAGKLAEEFFTLNPEMMNPEKFLSQIIYKDMMNELIATTKEAVSDNKDLVNLDQKQLSKIIDSWAKKENTAQVIRELKKIIGSKVSSNGDTIGQKKANFTSMSGILDFAYFSDPLTQMMASSIYGL